MPPSIVTLIMADAITPDDSIINEFKKSAVDNGAELVAMRKSFPDFSKVCLSYRDPTF